MHLEKGARLVDLHRKARERAMREVAAAQGRELAARDELTEVLRDASAYRNSLREAQAAFEGSACSILSELSQILLEARRAGAEALVATKAAGDLSLISRQAAQEASTSSRISRQVAQDLSHTLQEARSAGQEALLATTAAVVRMEARLTFNQELFTMTQLPSLISREVLLATNAAGVRLEARLLHLQELFTIRLPSIISKELLETRMREQALELSLQRIAARGGEAISVAASETKAVAALPTYAPSLRAASPLAKIPPFAPRLL